MLPPFATLPQILAHRLNTGADRVAVILATRRGDETLTIRQLMRGAAGYAERYRRTGVVANEVVVDLLPPGADLLFACLGAMLIGAVPAILPFPTEKLDPEYYSRSLLSLVEVTHPAALIAEQEFADHLRRNLSGSQDLKAILDGGLPNSAESIALEPTQWAGLARSPDDLALLQHSSGTTGLQKGVALSHRAILNQLQAYVPALGLTADDVVVSWLPLYHDMGLIAGFLLPLLCGLKLVLMSPFEWVRAPWLLLEAMTRHHGTLTWLPNFAYNFLAQRLPDSRLRGVDLSSWRAVINCSEPMYATSHRLFLERFSQYGLRAEALCTCYAMAENVFAVTQGGLTGPVNIDRVDAEQLETHGQALPATSDSRRVVEMLSAGPPLPNCRVRVEADDGRVLGEREVGELTLRSDCMLTSYYHRPDTTRAALRDGWYLTGDLGYLAEGQVYITGRKKDLIIVGGKNIYPQDIEQLINTVPGVYAGRVVAFGIPNPELGTEDVAAVVEVDHAAPAEPDRLKLAILQTVATESDVALRWVKLVDERWLIKTSSGKLARKANREKFLAELPGGGA